MYVIYHKGIKFLLPYCMFKGPFTNTCWGPDAKRGPFKFLTLVRMGPWKKVTTNFSVKIGFTCFSLGWPIIFMAKSGALFFLLLFWGLKGAKKKFHNQFFLHQAPLTSLCERSVTYCAKLFTEVLRLKQLKVMYRKLLFFFKLWTSVDTFCMHCKKVVIFVRRSFAILLHWKFCIPGHLNATQMQKIILRHFILASIFVEMKTSQKLLLVQDFVFPFCFMKVKAYCIHVFLFMNHNLCSR